jgi:hypothetical protein
VDIDHGEELSRTVRTRSSAECGKHATLAEMLLQAVKR